MLFRAPDHWVMAVLKGYLDDSGDEGLPSVVVAGYVGTCAAWSKFEGEWQSALDGAAIPYFHMKEISDPKSPMHKFYGRENYEASGRLFGNLARAIGNSSAFIKGFMAIGSVVSCSALARFNRERNRGIEALPLALFTCLGLIQTHYPQQTVKVLLDGISKAESKIATAKSYLATSKRDFSSRDDVAVVPAKGELNVKTVRGLQAADFAAYESFRKYERIDPFLKSVDLSKVQSNAQLWYEYEEWLERTNTVTPDERKSFTALGQATAFHCPIWTYEVLCSEDDGRNGIWHD
jgi:hypothetical protein